MIKDIVRIVAKELWPGFRTNQFVSLAPRQAKRGASSTTTAVTTTSRPNFDLYKPEGPQGIQSVAKLGRDRKLLSNVIATLLGGAGVYAAFLAFRDPEAGKFQANVDFTNWSDTHRVTSKRVYEPETEEDVRRVVQLAYTNGWRVRVVGSGISPNGAAFSSDCMISMALMSEILEVDREKMQVRVQAGARVQDVVDALRPYGLTLQNFASVREQQIGGFTQARAPPDFFGKQHRLMRVTTPRFNVAGDDHVSAHGTGATLPPVDEQVVALRLAAPGLGAVTSISRDEGAVFDLAKVGLGSLGVVTELTLQCVPAHKLLEHTFVATRAEVERKHARWLRTNKHVRYMWIPYTDSVVVVHSNETKRAAPPSPWFSKPPSQDQRLEQLRMLLMSHSQVTLPQIAPLTAMQLRDELIKLNPLDTDWIKQVNAAEAEYWKLSSGHRIGWSDEILGFDCGGQQWVLEVALPTGSLEKPTYKDLEYMKDLFELLEKHNIPAPAPIEQRWTSSSSSPMSPAHSSRLDDVHSWVGIIMYLPTNDPNQRAAIGAAFREYAALCERHLMPKYGAKWHWAKLEPGESAERHRWIQAHLRAHYPVDQLNTMRHSLDPENNFGNAWLNAILPLPRKPQ